MRRTFLLAGAAAMFLTAVAWVWWHCERSANVIFLTQQKPAEWIVYPKPPIGGLTLATRPQSMPELVALFRRTFDLKEPTASARLTVRACQRCSIWINGTRVTIDSTNRNWKVAQQAAIGLLLKPGANNISVEVHSGGPPALWLSVTGLGLEVHTDRSWEVSLEGAVWQPAQLATEAPVIRAGGPLAGGEHTLSSIGKTWPGLGLMALVAIAIVAGGRWWFGRNASKSKWILLRDPAVTLLTAIIVLCTLLVLHNLTILPRSVGYDHDAHIEYITYIQQHSALPLPNQGWEMHQPPLYYLLAAGLLNSFGLTATASGGLIALRLFALIIVLAHIVFVFCSLRLIFRGRILPQLVGLVLAGFMPMLLYMTHYVTNETLAACLMSGTVWLMLKVWRTEQLPIGWAAALGLCLGLALLSKVTAVILLPFVVATIILRASRANPGKPWALPLVATLSFVLACGWHYARLWRHFGNPLHGFGAISPVAQTESVIARSGGWTDPGYLTGPHFERFGSSLIAPFYTVFNSFADGLYSTMWGDGMWGGTPAFILRPPWNYDLMAVGYLLALIPTLFILSGLFLALVKAVRQLEPEWWVLPGFALAGFSAIAVVYTKEPSIGVVHAFYALGTLAVLCVLGGLGFELLTRRSKKVGMVAATGLAFWAINAYASFWVKGGEARTQALLGRELMKVGNYPEAMARLGKALQREPEHIPARSFLVAALGQQGRLVEAKELARQSLKIHPNEVTCHVDLATVLEAEGNIEEALLHTQRAVELAPNHPDARLNVAFRMFKLGRYPDAVKACREGLRFLPADPQLHFDLAYALVSCASKPQLSLDLSYSTVTSHSNSLIVSDTLISEAINHFRFAMALDSDSADTFNNLAWLLATYPESKFRNGAEAVALAKRACDLTEYREPSMLRTLAAAYAEAGEYASGLETAKKAGKLLEASGNDALREKNARLIELLNNGQPYRQVFPRRNDG